MSDENKAELFAALAAAQGEFPEIQKTRTVRVTMKSGGSYEFSYAPLDTLIECTRPALSKHGLAVCQTIDEGRVITIIMHASGAEVRLAPVPIDVPEGPSPQERGSALTYARRYSYSAALCIVADEDDDGNAASGNEAKFSDATRERPASQPQGQTPRPATQAAPSGDGGMSTQDVLKRCEELYPVKDAMYQALEWAAQVVTGDAKRKLKDMSGEERARCVRCIEARDVVD